MITKVYSRDARLAQYSKINVIHHINKLNEPQPKSHTFYKN